MRATTVVCIEFYAPALSKYPFPLNKRLQDPYERYAQTKGKEWTFAEK